MREEQVLQASIGELLAAFDRSALEPEALVALQIDRIRRWDRDGPEVRAMLAPNPQLQEGAGLPRVDGPLRGITFAVKDNCDTSGMPTTGGCVALATNQPRTNATVVQRLLEAGASIIGKANMHELAAGGTSLSSLGGQVKNPYDLTRTPGGSSGGSGVAVALQFATAAIGTDTVNSIRSPASANGIVGLRPTRGLVSRAGVIPVTDTQDAVGPMTRCVEDAARILDVIAGYDPADPVTACCVGRVPASYLDLTRQQGLQGRRVGFVASLQGQGEETEDVNAAVEQTKQIMARAGAHVVEINDAALDADKLVETLDVQQWEFGPCFEAYLEHSGVGLRTLNEMLAFGGMVDEGLVAFVRRAAAVVRPETDVAYLSRLRGIDRLKTELYGIMARHEVDVLAYPLQKCLVVKIGEGSQRGRNGIVAALSGFPALTVPMGFSRPDSNAPLGVPMGLDLLARPFAEACLLQVGHAFEQAAQLRCGPQTTGWP